MGAFYAAVATRPDIAHAVGVVAKYCSKPNETHLTAVKCILRYLKGTAHLGVRFTKSDNGQLVAQILTGQVTWMTGILPQEFYFSWQVVQLAGSAEAADSSIIYFRSRICGT